MCFDSLHLRLLVARMKTGSGLCEVLAARYSYENEYSPKSRSVWRAATAVDLEVGTQSDLAA